MLWRLGIGTFCYYRNITTPRYGLQMQKSLVRKPVLQKQGHIQQKAFSHQSTPKVSLKLSLGFITALGIRHWAGNLKVLCQASNEGTRLVGVDSQIPEPSFDWKKFLGMLWPHVWYLLAAVASALVVAVLNIQIPQLLGGVINVMATFIQGKEGRQFSSDMRAPVVRLLGMYSLQSVFTFIYIYLLSSVGERIAASMRKDLFASIMRQDMSFFDRHRTGEIVNRLTSDIQEFKSSFKLCISQGLRSTAQIVGCAVSLFIISPQMTAGMMVVIPAVIVTGTLIGSVLRKMSKQAQEQAARATSVSDEAISNIRTVRAFAMERKECELFNQQIEESRKLNETLGLGIGLFQAGTNIFLNGVVLATLCAGGYLLSLGQLSSGDLMAFLVAAQTIQRSLTQLSLLFGQVVRGLAAGGRVFEYLNMEPTMPLFGGLNIPFHSLLANVVFRDVTFSYPSRPSQIVLQHFDLELPAGKTVAIVGSSGSGKSTVAALLERFYDVDKGCISIDGVDIRNLDPSWLRGKAIGFINQEPVLFATSVMENIRYGRPDATDHEVIAAAKMANADEFITAFPNGYSTVVGERGVTVSGGQKQRIAIARALLKNPSILILDEATSALDASSEQLVQKALDNVTRGRTVLIIAHRLSTVQNADVIVVLNDGVIVETGTHSSLVKKRGFYWNLIKEQQKAEQTRGTA
ncbi:mitochondrial potassium channel ATP-binding subunit isoform X1 [Schistocerca cancellata]|uniref:mitochondrial potassium channel ATP-binding subunit isoform X1 n=2 Tax=Schistocerca cancellata TaxID=274614 RepID=UPI0021181131|nr:mitochondrial potassium channel ATP-binding subunit isoform X1 [Schistocerca cancellata]